MYKVLSIKKRGLEEGDISSCTPEFPARGAQSLQNDDWCHIEGKRTSVDVQTGYEL
jgi:hypothetical protein